MIFGKHINKYYQKYLLFIILGIITLLLVDYAQLEIPRICGYVLDGIKDGTLTDDGKMGSISNLFTSGFSNGKGVIYNIQTYMLYLILVALILFIGRFLWRYLIIGTAIKIEGDMRRDMFIKSEKMQISFYKTHKVGAIMALFTNDLSTINRTLGFGTVALIDAIFLGSLALYRMIRVNYILTLFSIIPMAIIVFLSFFIRRILKKKFTEKQESYDMLSDFAQENFSGIAVIKAFVKETNEIKRFYKVNDNSYKKNMEYIKIKVLLEVLLSMLVSTIIAILFAGGAYFVFKGKTFFGQSFTVGRLWEFISYFDILTWPFMAISMIIQHHSEGSASYKRIADFLDYEIDVKDGNVKDIKEIYGNIKFNHLTFSYPFSKEHQLNDLSFEIKKGEMVGLIGKTGSGKSTLVDLLVRLYNIDRGMLYYDDNDIMDIPIKVVRENIGYVPQDNFLFSDSIENNIAFSKDSVNKEEVIKYAKASDVYDNIMLFEKNFETVIGEKGVTLSGGQKQRISISRALLKEPNILIFDDSVSAVDTETEKEIIHNLKLLRKDKTTIIIAHRISTIETLDKIIILNDGKLSGVGTHQELLKNNSEYAELVRLQELEKEVDGGDIDE